MSRDPERDELERKLQDARTKIDEQQAEVKYLQEWFECEICDQNIYAPSEHGDFCTFVVCGVCWNKRGVEQAAVIQDLRGELAEARGHPPYVRITLDEYRELLEKAGV